MPGDMRPGTEWGMMWGFSDDVKLWVLFGGRPGLELKEREEEKEGERGVEISSGVGRVGAFPRCLRLGSGLIRATLGETSAAPRGTEELPRSFLLPPKACMCHPTTAAL
ncbi:unnamed protein product [Pleuronectes platessa]|uniref:Uncharacterized protein n=1 Tax=Pleuronectes platessa TaxID=8262 RepID=A0A9N7W1F2_PLEPL|nr:unnamed protein product [Pleuronectes platessa]